VILDREQTRRLEAPETFQRETECRLVRSVGPLGARNRCVPDPRNEESPGLGGFREERMKGLEPSTFCMASRRSSQLSYIRASPAV
jgi:hypothetical protein